MDALGWNLIDPGSAAGLDGSIAKHSEQGEHWFGYYWNPTSIIGKYDMRAIDMGSWAGADNWDGCVALGNAGCEASSWTASRVNTLLSDNMYYNGPTGAMAYFEARTYPGTVMNAMLVWMEDTGGTGADAATEFLSSQGDTWKAWVSADVAASVEASL